MEKDSSRRVNTLFKPRLGAIFHLKGGTTVMNLEDGTPTPFIIKHRFTLNSLVTGSDAEVTPLSHVS